MSSGGPGHLPPTDGQARAKERYADHKAECGLQVNLRKGARHPVQNYTDATASVFALPPPTPLSPLVVLVIIVLVIIVVPLVVLPLVVLVPVVSLRAKPSSFIERHDTNAVAAHDLGTVEQ